MLKKQDYQRQAQIEMISIENIVPKEHILRDIDQAYCWTGSKSILSIEHMMVRTKALRAGTPLESLG